MDEHRSGSARSNSKMAWQNNPSMTSIPASPENQNHLQTRLSLENDLQHAATETDERLFEPATKKPSNTPSSFTLPQNQRLVLLVILLIIIFVTVAIIVPAALGKFSKTTSSASTGSSTQYYCSAYAPLASSPCPVNISLSFQGDYSTFNSTLFSASLLSYFSLLGIDVDRIRYLQYSAGSIVVSFLVLQASSETESTTVAVASTILAVVEAGLTLQVNGATYNANPNSISYANLNQFDSSRVCGSRSNEALSGCDSVLGSYRLENSLFTTVSFSTVSISSGLVISGNTLLNQASFTRLTSVGGNLVIFDNAGLQSLVFSKLSRVAGSFEIYSLQSIALLNFPAITYIGSSIDMSDNPTLTLILLPSLSIVRGSTIKLCANAASLLFPPNLERLWAGLACYLGPSCPSSFEACPVPTTTTITTTSTSTFTTTITSTTVTSTTVTSTTVTSTTVTSTTVTSTAFTTTTNTDVPLTSTTTINVQTSTAGVSAAPTTLTIVTRTTNTQTSTTFTTVYVAPQTCTNIYNVVTGSTCTNVTGALQFVTYTLATIDYPTYFVGAAFNILYVNTLTRVAFNRLTFIGDGLFISSNPVLTVITMNNLVSVLNKDSNGNDFQIANNPKLTYVSFPSLTVVGDGISFVFCANGPSFVVPSNFPPLWETYVLPPRVCMLTNASEPCPNSFSPCIPETTPAPCASPPCPSSFFYNGCACFRLTQCSSSQFESRAPTDSSDRQCSNAFACDGTIYNAALEATTQCTTLFGAILYDDRYSPVPTFSPTTSFAVSSMSGAILISDVNTVVTFSFPSLTLASVGLSFVNSSVATISLPVLTFAGMLSFGLLPSLTSFTANALVSTSSSSTASLIIAENAALTFVEMAALTFVSKSLRIFDNPSLTFVSLPKLVTVQSAMFICGNGPSFTLPSPLVNINTTTNSAQPCRYVVNGSTTCQYIGVTYGLATVSSSCIAVSSCSSDQFIALAPTPTSNKLCFPKAVAARDSDDDWQEVPMDIAQLHTYIRGSLTYEYSQYSSLTIPMAYVGRNVYFTSNSLLTTVSIASLTYIGRDLSLIYNPVLSKLSIASLTFIGGKLIITSTPITSLSLTALTVIVGSFTIDTNYLLATLNVPVIQYIGGEIVLCQNSPSLGSLRPQLSKLWAQNLCSPTVLGNASNAECITDRVSCNV